VNITVWINCIVKSLIESVGTLKNGKQLEFCAKILKVRTYSLLHFSKRTLPAKKPLMSRVWWCSYHPTVKSCWVLVYSVLLYNVVVGVVLPGEIPPSWKLEWVDDDEWWHHGRPPLMIIVALVYFILLFSNSEPLLIMSWTMVCNN
jgi:hypothetical protein